MLLIDSTIRVGGDSVCEKISIERLNNEDCRIRVDKEGYVGAVGA